MWRSLISGIFFYKYVPIILFIFPLHLSSLFHYSRQFPNRVSPWAQKFSDIPLPKVLTWKDEICKRILHRPFTGFQYFLFVSLNLGKFASSYIWQSSCCIAIYKHHRICMKALNFFCFEHNDKTEPNLSWFLMQIDQFGKWKFSRSEYIHPSRRDCPR